MAFLLQVWGKVWEKDEHTGVHGWLPYVTSGLFLGWATTRACYVSRSHLPVPRCGGQVSPLGQVQPGHQLGHSVQNLRDKGIQEWGGETAPF